MLRNRCILNTQNTSSIKCQVFFSQKAVSKPSDAL
jgi:hypothetical protein